MSLDADDMTTHSAYSVEVFWRPGCPFCAQLRRGLEQQGVPAHWRDIWTDEEARAMVRAANDGDETVPTVRIGDLFLTNPSAKQVAEAAARAATAADAPPGSARR